MTGQERNYGFMKLSELTAYELLGEQELKDIHSMGYILRHKKSGARITVISNDDENKVFLHRLPHTAGGFDRCAAHH